MTWISKRVVESYMVRATEVHPTLDGPCVAISAAHSYSHSTRDVEVKAVDSPLALQLEVHFLKPQ